VSSTSLGALLEFRSLARSWRRSSVGPPRRYLEGSFAPGETPNLSFPMGASFFELMPVGGALIGGVVASTLSTTPSLSGMALQFLDVRRDVMDSHRTGALIGVVVARL
jgi:hypothetical protein